MADTDETLETLEKGEVYFFYRPRVEEHEPDDASDLQQLYMVLQPETGDDFRLAIIGRKKMPPPDQEGRARQWGYIDMARSSADDVREALQEEVYQTKTRGERRRPAARPCGEGVYRILRHDDHTHLAYELELPRSPGAVQDELEIEEQASYIITVKNPEKGSPRAAGLSDDRAADFPKTLQQKFRDRRFAPLDPPDFLDHEGAEFVLVAAADDVEEELGIRLDADRESRHSADVFKQMGVDKQERPVEPLLRGDWA